MLSSQPQRRSRSRDEALLSPDITSAPSVPLRTPDGSAGAVIAMLQQLERKFLDCSDVLSQSIKTDEAMMTAVRAAGAAPAMTEAVNTPPSLPSSPPSSAASILPTLTALEVAAAACETAISQRIATVRQSAIAVSQQLQQLGDTFPHLAQVDPYKAAMGSSFMGLNAATAGSNAIFSSGLARLNSAESPLPGGFAPESPSQLPATTAAVAASRTVSMMSPISPGSIATPLRRSTSASPQASPPMLPRPARSPGGLNTGGSAVATAAAAATTPSVGHPDFLSSPFPQQLEAVTELPAAVLPHSVCSSSVKRLLSYCVDWPSLPNTAGACEVSHSLLGMDEAAHGRSTGSFGNDTQREGRRGSTPQRGTVNPPPSRAASESPYESSLFDLHTRRSDGDDSDEEVVHRQRGNGKRASTSSSVSSTPLRLSDGVLGYEDRKDIFAKNQLRRVPLRQAIDSLVFGQLRADGVRLPPELMEGDADDIPAVQRSILAANDDFSRAGKSVVPSPIDGSLSGPGEITRGFNDVVAEVLAEVRSVVCTERITTSDFGSLLSDMTTQSGIKSLVERRFPATVAWMQNSLFPKCPSAVPPVVAATAATTAAAAPGSAPPSLLSTFSSSASHPSSLGSSEMASPFLDEGERAELNVEGQEHSGLHVTPAVRSLVRESDDAMHLSRDPSVSHDQAWGMHGEALNGQGLNGSSTANATSGYFDFWLASDGSMASSSTTTRDAQTRLNRQRSESPQRLSAEQQNLHRQRVHQNRRLPRNETAASVPPVIPGRNPSESPPQIPKEEASPLHCRLASQQAQLTHLSQDIRIQCLLLQADLVLLCLLQQLAVASQGCSPSVLAANTDAVRVMQATQCIPSMHYRTMAEALWCRSHQQKHFTPEQHAAEQLAAAAIAAAHLAHHSPEAMLLSVHHLVCAMSYAPLLSTICAEKRQKVGGATDATPEFHVGDVASDSPEEHPSSPSPEAFFQAVVPYLLAWRPAELSASAYERSDGLSPPGCPTVAPSPTAASAGEDGNDSTAASSPPPPPPAHFSSLATQLTSLVYRQSLCTHFTEAILKLKAMQEMYETQYQQHLATTLSQVDAAPTLRDYVFKQRGGIGGVARLSAAHGRWGQRVITSALEKVVMPVSDHLLPIFDELEGRHLLRCFLPLQPVVDEPVVARNGSAAAAEDKEWAVPSDPFFRPPDDALAASTASERRGATRSPGYTNEGTEEAEESDSEVMTVVDVERPDTIQDVAAAATFPNSGGAANFVENIADQMRISVAHARSLLEMAYTLGSPSTPMEATAAATASIDGANEAITLDVPHTIALLQRRDDMMERGTFNTPFHRHLEAFQSSEELTTAAEDAVGTATPSHRWRFFSVRPAWFADHRTGKETRAPSFRWQPVFQSTMCFCPVSRRRCLDPLVCGALVTESSLPPHVIPPHLPPPPPPPPNLRPMGGGHRAAQVFGFRFSPQEAVARSLPEVPLRPRPSFAPMHALGATLPSSMSPDAAVTRLWTSPPFYGQRFATRTGEVDEMQVPFRVISRDGVTNATELPPEASPDRSASSSAELLLTRNLIRVQHPGRRWFINTPELLQCGHVIAHRTYVDLRRPSSTAPRGTSPATVCCPYCRSMTPSNAVLTLSYIY